MVANEIYKIIQTFRNKDLFGNDGNICHHNENLLALNQYACHSANQFNYIMETGNFPVRPKSSALKPLHKRDTSVFQITGQFLYYWCSLKHLRTVFTNEQHAFQTATPFWSMSSMFFRQNLTSDKATPERTLKYWKS